jgi:hypothetical protein
MKEGSRSATLQPNLLMQIYGFDAALVLGGATAATDALMNAPASDAQ